MEPKDATTKECVHSQRCYEGVRPWPALYARPPALAKRRALEIKVMICTNLMRAYPGNWMTDRAGRPRLPDGADKMK